MKQDEQPIIMSRKVYNAIAEQIGAPLLPVPPPMTPEQIEAGERLKSAIAEFLSQESSEQD